MKKILFMLLGALLSLPAMARDFTYEYEGTTLTYTVIDEDAKTCMTKAGESDIPGNNVSGDLVIPSKVTDGEVMYTVTSLGEYAFNGCSGLTSVTIPESVTSIGNYAFEYCSGLTKAEFASIEALCRIKFENRDANPLYYAHHLYIDGEEVTELTIPESFTSIGSNAFAGCSGLTSVIIPESVTSIGSYAFGYCEGLTSVTIPESVTSIGEYVFAYCYGLTSVTISEGVTSIGEYTFYSCTGLTSVTIPESVTSISEGAFGHCEGLTSVTIPESVTSIDDYAFYSCCGLTSVTIPEGVISIGYEAFYECTGLISVTIPKSITSIGYEAFANCDGLTSVYYGADMPISSDWHTFSNNSYENATLYVPGASVEKCKTIDPWKNFNKIEAYDFSGIEEIIIDDFNENVPYEIYNINGVKAGDNINVLAPGLYIIRQGNTVRKITVN